MRGAAAAWRLCATGRTAWLLAWAAPALLVSCGHNGPMIAGVDPSDLAGIERNAERVPGRGYHAELDRLDAIARARPATSPFRKAVADWFNQTHPFACGDAPPGPAISEDERRFAVEPAALQVRFHAFADRVEASPLRPDLHLAWQQSTIVHLEAAMIMDCAPIAYASAAERLEAAHRDFVNASTTLDRMEGLARPLLAVQPWRSR